MAPQQATDRLTWAVNTLEIRRDDRVLEIGCGHGVAVWLVCEQLSRGTILAIDRSKKMIDAAKKRNAEHVRAGRASFQTVSLDKFNPRDAEFDNIFAIHVNLFVRAPADREFDIVKSCLARNGTFSLVDQPLDPSKASESAEAMKRALADHGFKVDRTRIEDVGAAVGVSVSARKH